MFVGVTDEYGKVYLPDLPPGEYTYRETNPPPGYPKNDDVYTNVITTQGT